VSCVGCPGVQTAVPGPTHTCRVMKLCLVLLSLTSILALPAPQTEDLGDDYGDYDESSLDIPAERPQGGLGDIIRLGTELTQGILALLSDKHLQNTVHTGLNLSRSAVHDVAVPVVRGFLASVPRVVNATMGVLDATQSVVRSQAVQESAGNIAGAGASVVQGVHSTLGQVPALVGQGSRLAGSVIHAANDTAPLILQGINEFTDQLPLIAGFASAYAEINAEQTEEVVRTFSRSLRCDLECKDMEESQAKTECEEKYCKKLEEEDEFSI